MIDVVNDTILPSKSALECKIDNTSYYKEVKYGCSTFTNTTTYPYTQLYKYGLCEFIIPSDELPSKPCYIDGLAFEVMVADVFYPTDLKIYLVPTRNDTFTSTTDWLLVEDSNLVYSSTSRSLGGSTGSEYIYFNQNNPFFYSGVGGIGVVVAKKADTAATSAAYKKCAATKTSNKHTLCRESVSSESYADPTNRTLSGQLDYQAPYVTIRVNSSYNVINNKTFVSTFDTDLTKTESGYAPYSQGSLYGLCEIIYTPKQLGNAAQTLHGMITDIQFNFKSAYSYTCDTIDIYMAHTDKVAFNGDGDWIDPTKLVHVAHKESYTIGATAAGDKLSLDNPFEYDGKHNLVVAISKKSTTSAGSSLNYITTTVNADNTSIGNIRLQRTSNSDESSADITNTSAADVVDVDLPTAQFYITRYETAADVLQQCLEGTYHCDISCEVMIETDGNYPSGESSTGNRGYTMSSYSSLPYKYMALTSKLSDFIRFTIPENLIYECSISNSIGSGTYTIGSATSAECKLKIATYTDNRYVGETTKPDRTLYPSSYTKAVPEAEYTFYITFKYTFDYINIYGVTKTKTVDIPMGIYWCNRDDISETDMFTELTLHDIFYWDCGTYANNNNDTELQYLTTLFEYIDLVKENSKKASLLNALSVNNVSIGDYEETQEPPTNVKTFSTARCGSYYPTKYNAVPSFRQQTAFRGGRYDCLANTKYKLTGTYVLTNPGNCNVGGLLKYALQLLCQSGGPRTLSGTSLITDYWQMSQFNIDEFAGWVNEVFCDDFTPVLQSTFSNPPFTGYTFPYLSGIRGLYHEPFIGTLFTDKNGDARYKPVIPAYYTALKQSSDYTTYEYGIVKITQGSQTLVPTEQNKVYPYSPSTSGAYSVASASAKLCYDPGIKSLNWLYKKTHTDNESPSVFVKDLLPFIVNSPYVHGDTARATLQKILSLLNTNAVVDRFGFVRWCFKSLLDRLCAGQTVITSNQATAFTSTTAIGSTNIDHIELSHTLKPYHLEGVPSTETNAASDELQYNPRSRYGMYTDYVRIPTKVVNDASVDFTVTYPPTKDNPTFGSLSECDYATGIGIGPDKSMFWGGVSELPCNSYFGDNPYYSSTQSTTDTTIYSAIPGTSFHPCVSSVYSENYANTEDYRSAGSCFSIAYRNASSNYIPTLIRPSYLKYGYPSYHLPYFPEENYGPAAIADMYRIGANANIVGELPFKYSGFNMTMVGGVCFELMDNLSYINPYGDRYDDLRVLSITYNWTGRGVTTTMSATEPDSDTTCISAGVSSNKPLRTIDFSKPQYNTASDYYKINRLEKENNELKDKLQDITSRLDLLEGNLNVGHTTS